MIPWASLSFRILRHDHSRARTLATTIVDFASNQVATKWFRHHCLFACCFLNVARVWVVGAVKEVETQICLLNLKFEIARQFFEDARDRMLQSLVVHISCFSPGIAGKCWKYCMALGCTIWNGYFRGKRQTLDQYNIILIYITLIYYVLYGLSHSVVCHACVFFTFIWICCYNGFLYLLQGRMIMGNSASTCHRAIMW